MPKKETGKAKSEKEELRRDSTNRIIGSNVKKKASSSKRSKKKEQKNKMHHKMVLDIMKWIILLALLIGAILFFLSTPLFNINEIMIINNSKISSDTIEELSGVHKGDNIYRLSKKQIEQNLKQNPYIESVQIKRKLPSTIEISIKERQATYVLQLGNGFMTMNNQGYFLEIVEETNGLPILIGFSTKVENIIEGQRLVEEDLNRLEVVLKIMETINVKGITEKVTQINVSNKQNYTLLLEEEGKTVYLGDASDISTRILYLKAILGQTKGKVGEIFINGDTEKSNPYFREKV